MHLPSTVKISLKSRCPEYTPKKHQSLHACVPHWSRFLKHWRPSRIFVCPLQKLFLGLILSKLNNILRRSWKPSEELWFLLCIPQKIWLCLIFIHFRKDVSPLCQKNHYLIWPMQIYLLSLTTCQTHVTLKCSTSQVALCSEMNSTNLFEQKLMWRRTFCAAGCPGRCLELKMLGL